MSNLLTEINKENIFPNSKEEIINIPNNFYFLKYNIKYIN